MSRDCGAFKNRQREMLKSTHVNFVGRHTRHRADRIVVCELDVRELQIPVVLSLIDDDSYHLSHSVVDPLNACVAVSMIWVCGTLAHSQQLVHMFEVMEQTGRRCPRAWCAGIPLA